MKLSRNSEEEESELIEWIESRPDHVKKVVKEYPWDIPYTLNGEMATILSYEEHDDKPVTVRVYIHTPYFPREVFGVNPTNLKRLGGGS